MAIDFEHFGNYASTVLKAKAFDTASGKESAHLFRTSLETTQGHINWANGANNAQGEIFQLTPGFLDIYQPNAFADRHNGKFIIAMHSALFVAITEFTMFCFAQSGFFPDIGDATKETSPAPINDRPPGLWLIDFTSTGGRVNDDHSARLIPKCTDRYVMSIYLALLMARFVWMHELAHCFNGHVGLIKEQGIAIRLYEAQDPQMLVGFSRSTHNAADVSKQLHCLELDADRSALWSSMRIQIDDNLENIAGIAELDKPTRQRLMLFGSYAMTWLFEEFQVYLRAQGGETHPLPYLRLHGLMQTSAEVFPAHIKDFAVMDAEVCSQFDFIRRSVPGFYESKSVMADRTCSGILDELGGLSKFFQSMLPDLEPLQFSQK